MVTTGYRIEWLDSEHFAMQLGRSYVLKGKLYTETVRKSVWFTWLSIFPGIGFKFRPNKFDLIDRSFLSLGRWQIFMRRRNAFYCLAQIDHKPVNYYHTISLYLVKYSGWKDMPSGDLLQWTGFIIDQKLKNKGQTPWLQVGTSIILEADRYLLNSPLNLFWSAVQREVWVKNGGSDQTY